MRTPIIWINYIWSSLENVNQYTLLAIHMGWYIYYYYQWTTNGCGIRENCCALIYRRGHKNLSAWPCIVYHGGWINNETLSLLNKWSKLYRYVPLWLETIPNLRIVWVDIRWLEKLRLNSVDAGELYVKQWHVRIHVLLLRATPIDLKRKIHVNWDEHDQHEAHEIVAMENNFLLINMTFSYIIGYSAYNCCTIVFVYAKIYCKCGGTIWWNRL